MVGDGNGFMSPGKSRFDNIAYIADRIHSGHLGVTVELHPFFRSIVGTANSLHRHNVIGLDGDFPVILIVHRFTSNQDSGALFERFVPLLIVHIVNDFHNVAGGIVGKAVSQDHLAAVPGDLGIHLKNIAPDDHDSAHGCDIPQRNRFLGDFAALQQNCTVLFELHRCKIHCNSSRLLHALLPPAERTVGRFDWCTACWGPFGQFGHLNGWRLVIAAFRCIGGTCEANLYLCAEMLLNQTRQ